jgi:hypothetical protein
MAQDPALLDFFSFTNDGIAGWVAVISFLGIGLPFLGVPQLLVRYMSCRDDNELKKARWVSIVVMACFGIGAVTAGIAGRALFPGLEDPETILEDMLSGLNTEQKNRCLQITNREEAIKTAFFLAQKGDIILIAGKGHEDYQEIKGIRYPFDDKEVINKLFKKTQ